jgi:hypothetical protein
MYTVAKNTLLILLLVFFLSCARNTGDQSISVPPDTNIVIGKSIDDPEIVQSVNVLETDCTLAYLTLIPSVEPELLRNVMPNSWHRLERLTEAEEQAFVIENINVLLHIEQTIEQASYNIGTPGYFSVYRQQVGIDTFYRVLVTEDSNPDFMSRSIRFVQFLVYRGRIIARGGYNNIHIARDLYYVFNSIDIIEGLERVKGIMITHLLYNETYILNDRFRGITGSDFYLWGDIINSINTDSVNIVTRDLTGIRIIASDSLVDPESPLRYSLQNAFDGDPSTAYVANVEGGLLVIDLSMTTYEIITRIAVINGRAENLSIYRKHDRIERIGIVNYVWNEDNTFLITKIDKEILLEDNYLSYQIFDVSSPVEIIVLTTYAGTTYNKTNLGGLNLYIDGLGWLFGDINE